MNDSFSGILKDRARFYARRLLQALREIFLQAVRIVIPLYRIMLPLLIVVKLLELSGIIEGIGKALAPVMGFVGLPGSMGLVWATGMTNGFYAALIILAALASTTPLTAAQATILLSMLLIAHNLVIEVRITQKAGVRAWFQVVWRLGCGLIYGWLLNVLYRSGSFLQFPNQMVLSSPPSNQTLPAWAVSQVENLARIFLIILTLVAVLKILEKLGITALLIRLLEPVLRLLGISRDAAPVTIIGMMLGLSLGGGLVIYEAQSGKMDSRNVFFSMALMGIFHSLIEDTMLVTMFGAHLSGSVWLRAVFTFIMVFLLVRLVGRMPERTFTRLFISAPRASKKTSEAG